MRTAQADEKLESLFKGLRFKVADAGEQTHALELRLRVYARDWPEVPENAVVDDLDARAYHFIAQNESGEVVAAFRMVGPQQRPFDIEHFLRIDEILSSDRSPAEVGRLCVRPDTRIIRSDAFVHLGLFKVAYDFAHKLKVTDLLMKAAPRLRNFYARAGFRPVGVAFRHPVYGEEQVMRLDLIALQSGLAGPSTAITRYLLNGQLSNFDS